MSHFHIRSDKTCLNCGAQVPERYCTVCGQENVEPRETLGHLLRHFFEDITHFDGKFFSTIKYLYAKPGYLTEEYLAGRRMRFLHPVRMYMFVSAFFFFMLITFFLGSLPLDVHNVKNKKAGNGSIYVAKPGEKNVNFTYSKDTTKAALHTLRSRLDSLADADSSTSYKTVREYDSAQKSLPANKRDGFAEKYFTRKNIAASEMYDKDRAGFFHSIFEKFMHSLPQMFFISLPLFALVLQLLYIRRRQYNYVAHAIFAIHYYCFIFLTWVLLMTIGEMGTAGRIIESVLYLSFWVYLYIAMLRFYKQGWFKTFIKFFLLNFCQFVILIALGIFFVVSSVFSLAGG